MKPMDIAVLSALAAILFLPAVAKFSGHIVGAVRSLLPGRATVDPHPSHAEEDWRQEWTRTLITLLDEIQHEVVGPMPKAEALTKELIWRVIAGDQTPMPTDTLP